MVPIGVIKLENKLTSTVTGSEDKIYRYNRLVDSFQRQLQPQQQNPFLHISSKIISIDGICKSLVIDLSIIFMVKIIIIIKQSLVPLTKIKKISNFRFDEPCYCGGKVPLAQYRLD